MNVLIMKIQDNKAVLLDAEGQFRTVQAGKDWEPGMEIEYNVVQPKARRVVRLVAAAATLVLLLGAGYIGMFQTPVSYVDVSINPSVRIKLNTFSNAIGMEGINNDGRALIAKLESRSGEMHSALKGVLVEAINEGYITPEKAGVQLTISNKDSTRAMALERDLLEYTDGVLTEKGIKAELNTKKMPLEEYNRMSAYISQQSQTGSDQDVKKLEKEWQTQTSSLWMEEIEYMGGGKMEVELTGQYTVDANSKAEIVLDSVRKSAEIKRTDDDEMVVQAQGLEDDKIYVLELSGIMDSSGKPLSLSGSFLARKGKETHTIYDDGENRGEHKNEVVHQGGNAVPSPESDVLITEIDYEHNGTLELDFNKRIEWSGDEKSPRWINPANALKAR